MVAILKHEAFSKVYAAVLLLLVVERACSRYLQPCVVHQLALVFCAIVVRLFLQDSHVCTGVCAEHL